ncbi:MAG: hypothetical protein ACOYD3_03350 [Kiritimatiellia bacterium]|jgi:hypothetical protein
MPIHATQLRTWAMVALLLCAPALCTASDMAVTGETYVITLDDDIAIDPSRYLITTNHVTFINGVPYCSLHYQQLRTDWVPVIYGTIFPNPELSTAEQDSFPHAANRVYGGCIRYNQAIPPGMIVFSPTPPTLKRVGAGLQRLVSYCPTCREAKSAWLLQMNAERKSR